MRRSDCNPALNMFLVNVEKTDEQVVNNKDVKEDKQD
jgi:hypothetical protein